MRILVVNAGSSSLKLRVLGDGDRTEAAADPEPGDDGALERFVRGAGPIDAVGHRVVHGGDRYLAPVVLDDDVVGTLGSLVPLAPLHQPPALAAIGAVTALVGDRPAVACFDTAFHATLPAAAATYPLPRQWREQHGIRRFGFHGLSHAHAVRATGELLGRRPSRMVTCHLGSGSSITAVRDGRSVDTTMGFTPNAGVPMSTRAGSIDADLVSWLLRQGMPPDELEDGLQRRAGLAGIAGEGDVRHLLGAAAAGDGDAQLALDVWVLRVSQAIAAMATAAGGLDALTFTGGIGEHAAPLRRRLIAELAWLGVDADADADTGTGSGTDTDTDTDGPRDRIISSAASRAAVAVVASREDLEIARAVRGVLARP